MDLGSAPRSLGVGVVALAHRVDALARTRYGQTRTKGSRVANHRQPHQGIRLSTRVLVEGRDRRSGRARLRRPRAGARIPRPLRPAAGHAATRFRRLGLDRQHRGRGRSGARQYRGRIPPHERTDARAHGRRGRGHARRLPFRPPARRDPGRRRRGDQGRDPPGHALGRHLLFDGRDDLRQRQRRGPHSRRGNEAQPFRRRRPGGRRANPAGARAAGSLRAKHLPEAIGRRRDRAQRDPRRRQPLLLCRTRALRAGGSPW